MYNPGAMPERIVFSTKDFELRRSYSKYSIGITPTQTCISESASLGDGLEGIASMFYLEGQETPQFINHVAHDLNQGITIYYDYNYWPSPFPEPFCSNDPNFPYKAVISLNAASVSPVRRMARNAKYGIFWYGCTGELQAIDGGSLNKSPYESKYTFLKFRKLDGNWQTFRYLEGYCDSKRPEVVISNGRDLEVDELVVRIDEDRDFVRFCQRTVTGHKEKLIEIPARVDMSRWVDVLGSTDGGWVRAFKEFPAKMELVV